ncbi:hypothetical protein Pint_04057 [Pistacia integerrima]|uniref:Uncharacterized protein n=1 Tax=Pistacia integerrima TaxID=434235 RepID=A0ACC0Z3Z0_9ROSI|nr:hypothetical protein Pint_04057 [Pistacia integerrima]
MAANKLQAFWNHPAGPKTKLIAECNKLKVHFWAPTFKWGISVANIADFSKPPEKLSYPQQLAVTFTGLIWTRYSLVITPKNWNLFSVNVAMAGTGLYQLSRKINFLNNQKEAEVTTYHERVLSFQFLFRVNPEPGGPGLHDYLSETETAVAKE